MPTLVHLCGFEENAYTDNGDGIGVHGYTDTGTLSFDSTVKRNGRYSLRMQPAGSNSFTTLKLPLTSTNKIVSSFYVRWDNISGTQPVTQIFATGAAIRIDGSGVTSALAGTGGTPQTGPTIAAGSWHLIEMFWDASANPHVLKWRVNSSAQTDATFAAAATSVTRLDLWMGSSTTYSDVYFDDWAVSATGADYPLGPVAVEGLFPTGDGTHSNDSHFKDQTGTVLTGTTTSYTFEEPSNASTYVYQFSTGSGDYLEWTLPDTTRTNPILGAVGSLGYRGTGTVPGTYAALKLHNSDGDVTIYNSIWGTLFWHSRSSSVMLTAPGGLAWTAARLNACTLRYGYVASSISSLPWTEMVLLEVAFDDDPPETDPGGGGPDPDPDPEPDHVPGIWVDWNGDGTGWTDETTRVTSMTWSRGASFDHVSAAGPGNATIVVQNADHRFNPDNTGGTLYGKLLPARPVWGGADVNTGSLTTAASADVRGFFGGYISEIVPTPVPGANPTAEILCEDAFGWYRRATATVSPLRNTDRSTFRQSVLTSIGEDPDRRDLEAETETMPFASADTRDALSTLDELNRSNSARHFIAPADFKERTYYYTLVNRLHKLIDAEDESWNADDIQDISGYRVTVDNVDNLQRATVSPISFGAVNEIVWTATPLPMVVTVGEPIVLWPEFADYVFDAAVQINSTGGTIASTLTNFGTSAKLELTATGSAVNITALDVTGSSLRRGDLQTVRSEDTTSQAAYGVRAGGDVSTDYIGQPGAAKAVTDYLVWKFAQPLKRPTVTRAGKDAATIASLLNRDLFDVITLTVDRLDMVARRFEIIGIRGELRPKAVGAPFYSVSYELQETPNQEPLDYWIWDSSSWDGGDFWAPF